MAVVFKQEFYDLHKLKKPNQYIETGTYLGYGVLGVLGHYDKIHSIELSKKLYDYNVKQFSSEDTVIIHHGDSKVLLTSILQTINEPALIFLDAHYSGGTTAYGEEEVPLLHELEILAKRKYDDIIVIDDCRLLGKKGKCGAKQSKVYPPMNYDWTTITIQEIKNRMKKNYKLFDNMSKYYKGKILDRYILIPVKE